MALPSERRMPVIRAEWSELRKAWLVALPGGVVLPAKDTFDAELLVAKHAPFSDLVFVRDAFRSDLVERRAPVRSEVGPERVDGSNQSAGVTAGGALT